MVAQPSALMPPWLEEDVVTRPPGGFPAQSFAELQAVHARLFAEEAGVGGPAVLAAEVLREDGRRVSHEPRERRVRGGKAPPDLVLQGKEEYPKHALAELDAVLDDAVALVLVGRGRLLEDSAALQFGETLTESEDSVLVVALEGYWLASCDAEVADAFLCQ